MDPLLILIDGYNVIRNTPALSAVYNRGKSASREALLTQVAAAYRHTPHSVVVVFDGDGESERTEAAPRLGRIRVMYTARGQTADDAIVRLSTEAKAYGKPVKVVTRDAELRQRTDMQGAESARPEDLAQHLNQPSRDVVKKYQYRSAIQRQWEKDADEDYGHREKKGNPRKAPKRRRGASEPRL